MQSLARANNSTVSLNFQTHELGEMGDYRAYSKLCSNALVYWFVRSTVPFQLLHT